MRYLLPLALIATVGCYSPRALGTGEPWPDDGYGAGSFERLDARLWFDEITGLASFEVTRPAHVAIFALRPGAALEMIYPSFGHGRVGQRFSGGSHWIRTSASSTPHRFAGNWSAVHGSGPIYILLIASESPLQVSRFLHTGRAMGLHRASLMHSPYMAVEALASEVVPNPRSTEWTSAIHVVWPRDVFPRSTYRGYPDYVNVRCPSGIVLTVPAEAWRRGYVQCPLGEQPPDSTGTPEDSTSSSGIRDGLPERPVPPGWMGAERDRGVRVTSIADSVSGKWSRSGGGIERPARPEVTPVTPPVPVIRRGIPAAASRGGESATRPGTARRPDARSGWGSGSTRPAARPASSSRPATRPAARPATRPEAKPASRPETRPAPKPRPAPKSRPAKPKPKPDPDGNG